MSFEGLNPLSSIPECEKYPKSDGNIYLIE
jgi:hypothetical protein